MANVPQVLKPHTTCGNALHIEISRAPRGLDAANLWANSLGHPPVAANIAQRFKSDLESKTGTIMALWRCAQIVSWGQTYASAYGQATIEANRILKEI